jgi:tRNA 2-thiouridine synthesizing protein A
MAKTDLDYRGMSCPMPMLKLSMATRKGATGDSFEVVCDDPAFEPDIKSWCEKTGIELTSFSKTGKDIIATITKK